MKDTTELLSHIKLRFNIEHPSFEECYLDGYHCAKADISEEDNPFNKGSLEYEKWQDGWWAGFYGEEPLFSQTEDSELVNPNEVAANDQAYPFISNLVNSHVLANILKITGAIAATAVVGYQVMELVA
ncbi:MAG: transmission trait enhancer LetE [Tatlockia sp.]|nr:transmission trait enhancer LetE [Tatlockia sp.]